MVRDTKRRQTLARKDTHWIGDTIARARSFIYEKGYGVTSKAVEDLLKPESLVPTEVSSPISTHIPIKS